MWKFFFNHLDTRHHLFEVCQMFIIMGQLGIKMISSEYIAKYWLNGEALALLCIYKGKEEKKEGHSQKISSAILNFPQKAVKSEYIKLRHNSYKTNRYKPPHISWRIR